MNPFTYDSQMRNISIQATFFSGEVHICATKITRSNTRPTQGVGRRGLPPIVGENTTTPPPQKKEHYIV